jgi:glutaryl-CoA dehydrogenase
MSVSPAVSIKSAKSAFQWDDPFLIADQLSDEERMIADAAAAFAADKLMPRVTNAYLNEETDREIFSEMGQAGLLGVTVPEAVWRRGGRLRLLRPGGARGRTGRFRLPLDDERAVVAGDVSDPRLWQRRAADEISAETRQRRVGRLLRPDRAGCRLRPGRHEDPGQKDRRRLRAHRLEDVDLERADRRRVRCLGQVGSPWRRDPRLRARKGHEGAVSAQDRRQAELRASITGEIVMDNVEVGEEALLPNVSGLKGPFGCLNRARYGISWGAMGAAEDCWHRARQYGLDRTSSASRWPARNCSRRSSPTCRPKSRSACRVRCASAG